MTPRPTDPTDDRAPDRTYCPCLGHAVTVKGWARARRFVRVFEYKMLAQGVLFAVLAPLLPFAFLLGAALNAWDVSAFVMEGESDVD